jgi:hypothetical protein
LLRLLEPVPLRAEISRCVLLVLVHGLGRKVNWSGGSRLRESLRQVREVERVRDRIDLRAHCRAGNLGAECRLRR